MKINILGVNLNSDLSRDNFLRYFQDLMKNAKQNYIVTPNPEIILKAQKDEEYLKILNKADLSLPDGFGLNIAAALMGRKIKRLTGSDSILDIFSLAEKEAYKILIINNEKGLSSSSDISSALKEKYPELNFVIKDLDPHTWPETYSDNILHFAPDILVCNFGAPQQERFVFYNLAKIPSLKVGIGIGGALDFISGKAKRAPLFLRQIGLEWLWRLIRQPERYKRMYRAVFVFMGKFIQWRFFTRQKA